MRRLSLFLLLPIASGIASRPLFAAPTAALAIDVRPVASPARAGAMGSSLTSSEGAHWLSWLEPMAGGRHALKCAPFNLATRVWGEPRTIAEGANWFVNWADFPVLAAQGSTLTAAWFVRNEAPGASDHAHGHGKGYHAQYSRSTDGGRTWSPAAPLTTESTSVEFVAFQPIAGGRLLAAWLDGRARATTHRQTVYSRIVGAPGPDLLVDDFVCDCCQLSLAATPADGAVLAYRGRDANEIRDLRVARFAGDAWGAPRALHDDGWKIAACPVNGPQLATAGGATIATWFTAANQQSRVYAARALAGGIEFGPPARVDLGRPMGRVDTVMQSDGTGFVTWLEGSGAENEGGIYLRRLSSRGDVSPPALIAATTTSRASGFPRVTLLESEPAAFLLSYTREGDPTHVVTAVVTVR